MLFTTKAEYGVRFLIELGRSYGHGPVALKTVAENEQLPLAYLERIASLLRKANLVEATRGAHGGYQLTCSPEQITMDNAVLALEGVVAPMECFFDESTGRVLCSHQQDEGHGCATKLLWMKVQNGVHEALRAVTLAELVAFGQRQTHVPTSNEHPLLEQDQLVTPTLHQ